MKGKSAKAEKRALVRAANKLKDPFSLLKESERTLLSLSANGRRIDIASAKFSELDSPIKDWILDLWKRNMKVS